MARSLFLLVAVVVLVGLLLGVSHRIPFLSWLGRLPGDIRIEGRHSRFYFPITTSIVLTIVVYLLLKSLRFLVR